MSESVFIGFCDDGAHVLGSWLGQACAGMAFVLFLAWKVVVAWNMLK